MFLLCFMLGLGYVSLLAHTGCRSSASNHKTLMLLFAFVGAHRLLFNSALTLPSQRLSTCLHRIGRTRSHDAGVQVSVRAAPDAGGVGKKGEHTRRHPVATGELWKPLRMSSRSCRDGVCRAILICSAALDITAFFFCLFLILFFLFFFVI